MGVGVAKAGGEGGKGLAINIQVFHLLYLYALLVGSHVVPPWLASMSKGHPELLSGLFSPS